MEHNNRNLKARWIARLLFAAVAAIALAGCGSSSDRALSVLHQTFAGKHQVSSGNLAVLLSVAPSAAGGVKEPVTLGLAGPFQSRGWGRIPASAFDVRLGAMGKNVAVTITSTGSSGYVTFRGQSYELPPATFQRLESTFVRLSSVSAGGNGAGALARLGIDPERWLVSPQIVGEEAISGTSTTHIRAGVNVAALLSDVGTLLRRAASAGATGARSLLPPASRSRIAGQVKNPVVDVWSGVADKTLRQLMIGLSVHGAAIRLTMRYSDLNQPQTITAPTRLLPYRRFQDKLSGLLQDFAGGLTSATR
ncbi:MAG TPA: hypothetical protein VGI50_11010 [Solirubrobacteraceae bacterium]|jgi:hypothetical protein